MLIDAALIGGGNSLWFDTSTGILINQNNSEDTYENVAKSPKHIPIIIDMINLLNYLYTKGEMMSDEWNSCMETIGNSFVY